MTKPESSSGLRIQITRYCCLIAGIVATCALAGCNLAARFKPDYRVTTGDEYVQSLKLPGGWDIPPGDRSEKALLAYGWLDLRFLDQDGPRFLARFRYAPQLSSEPDVASRNVFEIALGAERTVRKRASGDWSKAQPMLVHRGYWLGQRPLRERGDGYHYKGHSFFPPSQFTDHSAYVSPDGRWVVLRGDDGYCGVDLILLPRIAQEHHWYLRIFDAATGEKAVDVRGTYVTADCQWSATGWWITDRHYLHSVNKNGRRYVLCDMSSLHGGGEAVVDILPTEVEVLGFEDWRVMDDWSKPTNPYGYRWQERFQGARLVIRAPGEAKYGGILQIRNQRGADKPCAVTSDRREPQPGMRYLSLDAPASHTYAATPLHFHNLVLGRQGRSEQDWEREAALRADLGYSRKYLEERSTGRTPRPKVHRERDLDHRGDREFRTKAPRYTRARLALSFAETVPPAEANGTTIYTIDCRASFSDGSEPDEPPLTQFSAVWDIPGAKLRSVPSSAPCTAGATELHFTPPPESIGSHRFGVDGKAYGFGAGQTELKEWRSPGIGQSFELSPNHRSGARVTFDVGLADGSDKRRLRYLDLLFNTAPDPAGGCGIRRSFSAGAGAGLMDDQGTVPRFANVLKGEPLSNARCAVEQDTYRTQFSVRFKPEFAGKKNVYVRTTDRSFETQDWKKVGTWTVDDNEAPNLVAVSPYQGRGRSTTFTFVVSDPNGGEDVRSIEGLLNRGPSQEEACRFELDLPEQRVVLYDDSGGVAVGSIRFDSRESISNDRCRISQATAEEPAARVRTAKIDVAFADRFSGRRNLYVRATDKRGLATGRFWQGTWLVP